MAVSRVTFSHNLDSAVDYGYKGKPHTDDPYINGQRALAIHGINGSGSPRIFKKENSTALRLNPAVKNGSVQCIRTIISFDPKKLSYKNMKDRHIALAIASRFCRHKYPSNQSIIFLQADAGRKQHILHCHCITVARRFTDGGSVTHWATFKRTYPFVDEAVEHYMHSKPRSDPNNTQHMSHNIAIGKMMLRRGITKTDKNGNKVQIPNRSINGSLVYYVRHTILSSAKHSNSLRLYLNKVNSKGVRPVDFFKMQRDKGKSPKNYFPYRYKNGPHKGQYKPHKLIYHLHFYKHNTIKNVKYIPITKEKVHNVINSNSSYRPLFLHSNIQNHIGEYLRLKKHIDYSVKVHNHTFRFRTKALGSDTDLHNVLNIISRNAQGPHFGTTYKRVDPPEVLEKTYIVPGQSPQFMPISNKQLPSSKYASPKRAQEDIKLTYGIQAPQMIPKKMPRPKKPSIDPNKAMNELINAATIAINKAKNQAEREAMMRDALQNYANEKQKAAEDWATYKAISRLVSQQNSDIEHDIQRSHLEYNQQLQELRIRRHLHQSNNGFNGPTLTRQ